MAHESERLHIFHERPALFLGEARNAVIMAAVRIAAKARVEGEIIAGGVPPDIPDMSGIVSAGADPKGLRPLRRRKRSGR